jgi:hypothetical protein
LAIACINAVAYSPQYLPHAKRAGPCSRTTAILKDEKNMTTLRILAVMLIAAFTLGNGSCGS